MFIVDKSGKAVKFEKEKIIIMPPEKITFNVFLHISSEYIPFKHEIYITNISLCFISLICIKYVFIFFYNLTSLLKKKYIYIYM